MALPSAKTLIEEAEARTGLSDWGDFDITGPLEVLVNSVNTEAKLHERGEQASRERLAFVLGNSLRMIEDRKRWPQIAQEEIRAPIVIPGLPRSGTTVLLQLLSQDPANRSPLTWEILAPSPPPEAATYGTDPRIEEVQALLDRAGFTRPELMAIHPYGAKLAEECIFIFEHTVAHGPYRSFWDCPSYSKLTAAADDRATYQVHKKVLQQLQFRNPAERWVLKSPSHMFHLPALIETYPDAVFIQTHRDLGRIMPSLAGLLSILRRTFSDDPAATDMHAAAQWALSVWRTGLEAMTEFRQRPGMNDRFVDVDYKTMLADPLAGVEQIYHQLGLPLSAVAKARMEAWLGQNRQGRHGAYEYSLAGCGLTEQDIEDNFGAYMERYSVTREART